MHPQGRAVRPPSLPLTATAVRCVGVRECVGLTAGQCAGRGGRGGAGGGALPTVGPDVPQEPVGHRQALPVGAGRGARGALPGKEGAAARTPHTGASSGGPDTQAIERGPPSSLRTLKKPADPPWLASSSSCGLHQNEDTRYCLWRRFLAAPLDDALRLMAPALFCPVRAGSGRLPHRLSVWRNQL